MKWFAAIRDIAGLVTALAVFGLAFLSTVTLILAVATTRWLLSITIPAAGLLAVAKGKKHGLSR